MIRLITIVGARPQFIKAAAMSRAIRERFSDCLHEELLNTGQHYDDDMSAVFFSELGMDVPAFNLNIGSGSHGRQTAAMMIGIEDFLDKNRPDGVVLYGDTNSTLAGALVASKMNIPLVHIEAGLRSFNRRMPEEINRILTDHVSTLLFVPSAAGMINLENEGVRQCEDGRYDASNPGVFHCGDVMYDNCLYYTDIAEKKTRVLEENNLKDKEYILLTLHRDSNTDNVVRLLEIMSAISDIADIARIPIVLPAHPRTRKALEKASWKKPDGILMTGPASYLAMMRLERHASMIITDSGGVQKEAYFHKNKCLVLRDETEWVELLYHGMLRLAGSKKEEIVKNYLELNELNFSDYPPLYGDGHAADFISDTIVRHFS